MKKIAFIAVQEYARNVFKKSFLLVLSSVPIFIAFSIGLGFFLESLKDDPSPVGYVDQAGIFPKDALTPDIRSDWNTDYGELVNFQPYPTEEEARKALDAQGIQAYILIPSDYLETRKITIYAADDLGHNATQQFFDLLQFYLLKTQLSEVAVRAAVGTEVTIRSVDGYRTIPEGGPSFGLMMPLFITMAFLFLLLMSSGYIMGAITEEKENRTIEIIISSMKPIELITGKIFGILAIGLTLLATWAVVIFLGIVTARQMGVAWFDDLNLDWRTILATVLVALPAYVLAAALMTAIGSMTTTTQEAQSISAVVIIPHLLPLYVSWAFINDPHSALAVLLSFFPFTSLVTIGMRNLFTIVPAWQVATSAVIQVISATAAVWLAGRAFRLGMLRYGQRLTFRGLLKKQA